MNCLCTALGIGFYIGGISVDMGEPTFLAHLHTLVRVTALQ